MFRRCMQRARQTTSMDGKNFVATSNLRNETMLKEANMFAVHLRKCDNSLQAFKLAGEAMLTNTKATMAAPLPHTFEETAVGSGGEVRAIATVGGPTFNAEGITALLHNSSSQLESLVLVPIRRWLKILSDLQHRNKEVEALRLEVDSRRHTVLSLSASVDKQRSKLAKADSSKQGKIETCINSTIKKLQEQEGKLKLTTQAFQEKEQALYTDLTTLIKDAVWLKHYYATALKAQAEVLTGAAAAVGDTAAAPPLPVSAPGSPQDSTEAGSYKTI